jgi:hypothetical protein
MNPILKDFRFNMSSRHNCIIISGEPICNLGIWEIGLNKQNFAMGKLWMSQQKTKYQVTVIEIEIEIRCDFEILEV